VLAILFFKGATKLIYCYDSTLRDMMRTALYMDIMGTDLRAIWTKFMDVLGTDPRMGHGNWLMDATEADL
jgi:hypothetical protein